VPQALFRDEVGTEWLMRYVPLAKAETYRKRGWEIYPLLGKHGVWSVLAVKKVEGKGGGERIQTLACQKAASG
jgi:hypothetical protein